MTRLHACVLLLCTLNAGCARESRAQETVVAKDLIGAWELQTVADKPPASINMKTWRVNFLPNKQWSFSGTMNENFGGMAVNGEGTWSLVSGELEYTAGSNHGRTKLAIAEGILTLSPDPIIRPDGKTPAVATYRQQK